MRDTFCLVGTTVDNRFRIDAVSGEREALVSTRAAVHAIALADSLRIARRGLEWRRYPWFPPAPEETNGKMRARRWLLIPLGVLVVAGGVVFALGCGKGGRSKGSMPEETSNGSHAPSTPSAAPLIASTSKPIAAPQDCPEGMAQIPGGQLTLGGSEVTMDGFCLDITEVTVDGYAPCVSLGRCSYPNTDRFCNWGKSGMGSHPINCVDWQQAVDYCAFAGKVLPTEAQWQHAAKGGAKRLRYPWGKDEPNESKVCWNRRRSNQGTCVVGSFPAGAFGLKDMAGNVWEWVADWHSDFPGTAGKSYADPSRGTGHVIRGGSWLSSDEMLLGGGGRSFSAPSARTNGLGFRCAKTK